MKTQHNILDLLLIIFDGGCTPWLPVPERNHKMLPSPSSDNIPAVKSDTELFDIYTVSNASHTSQITASEVLRQKEVEGDGGNGHISVLKLGIWMMFGD